MKFQVATEIRQRGEQHSSRITGNRSCPRLCGGGLDQTSLCPAARILYHKFVDPRSSVKRAARAGETILMES